MDGDFSRTLRRLEERGGHPEGLVRRPAVQGLGSLVPVEDQAGRRRSDDGVVRGLDDRREALEALFGPLPICDVDEGREGALNAAELDPDDRAGDVANSSRARSQLDLLEGGTSFAVYPVLDSFPVAWVAPQAQLERRAPEQL